MKESLAAAAMAFCVTFLLLGPFAPKTDAERLHDAHMHRISASTSFVSKFSALEPSDPETVADLADALRTYASAASRVAIATQGAQKTTAEAAERAAAEALARLKGATDPQGFRAYMEANVALNDAHITAVNAAR